MSFAHLWQPFGDDHEKEFIYKEPKVTTLGELMLRMQKLYARKFGASNIVHIIQEAGKVWGGREGEGGREGGLECGGGLNAWLSCSVLITGRCYEAQTLTRHSFRNKLYNDYRVL